MVRRRGRLTLVVVGRRTLGGRVSLVLLWLV